VYNDIIPQIKDLIVKSMYAVRKKLDPHRRKHTFELFGYDFILDEDFNVWLIEVNTNPCIEESSELLKVFLARMIEDLLKITVFPRIHKKGRGPARKATNPLTTISSPQKQQVKKGAPLANIPEEGIPNGSMAQVDAPNNEE
jgi:hypothetical protein